MARNTIKLQYEQKMGNLLFKYRGAPQRSILRGTTMAKDTLRLQYEQKWVIYCLKIGVHFKAYLKMFHSRAKEYIRF